MNGIDENGVLTEEFKTEVLPEILGDSYYNDPETKQQPTKAFENIKDVQTLLKSHLEGQRTISKGDARFEEKLKGMVKVPGENDTADEIKAFRTATGVPDTKDGYELTIPAESDDKEAYELLSGFIREAAHGAGVAPSRLSAVWNKVVEVLEKRNKDLETKGLEMMKADEESLKGKYKEHYDDFVNAGDMALGKFKCAADVTKVLDAYGIKNHPAIRELLFAVAPLVLEDKTILGQGKGGEDGKGWFTDYSEVGKD